MFEPVPWLAAACAGVSVLDESAAEVDVVVAGAVESTPAA